MAKTEQLKVEPSLNQLILDRSKDKYRLVQLALRWAQEIKQRDQLNEPPQEVLQRAVKEILAGQVEIETIEKLPPLPKMEAKPLDILKGDMKDVKLEPAEDEKKKSKKNAD